MKKPKIPTLKERANSLYDLNKHLVNDNMMLRTRLMILEKDNAWLRQLVQEMSATMNAGAKEGIFPRRNG